MLEIAAAIHQTERIPRCRCFYKDLTGPDASLLLRAALKLACWPRELTVGASISMEPNTWLQYNVPQIHLKMVSVMILAYVLACKAESRERPTNMMRKVKICVPLQQSDSPNMDLKLSVP